MPHPPIRSYARREGRITKGQTRALQDLWPVYGIEAVEDRLDLEKLFDDKLPIVLDIGFGDGDALASMAAANPQWNFLGVEVYRPGVGSLLLKLERLRLPNVRVAMQDVQLMVERIGSGRVSKILIFFPDPWPKKRHHKRRLLNPAFVGAAVDRLRPGGLIHAATDWADYADYILAVFEAEPRLHNAAGEGAFMPRPAYRPQTKYETRGQLRGHQVWDIVFERIA